MQIQHVMDYMENFFNACREVPDRLVLSERWRAAIYQVMGNPAPYVGRLDYIDGIPFTVLPEPRPSRAVTPDVEAYNGKGQSIAMAKLRDDGILNVLVYQPGQDHVKLQVMVGPWAEGKQPNPDVPPWWTRMQRTDQNNLGTEEPK